MEETTDLLKLRRDKLQELRDKGINPYINRFHVTTFISDLIQPHLENTKEELEEKNLEVVVAGRIMSRRKHGKTSFCNIKDGTGQTIDVQAREVITEMDSASSASMEVEVEGEQGHEAKEKVTSGMDGGAEGEPLSDAEVLALAREAYGRLVDLRRRRGPA